MNERVGKRRNKMKQEDVPNKIKPSKTNNRKTGSITKLQACEFEANAKMKQPCLSGIVHVRSQNPFIWVCSLHIEKHTHTHIW